ncbi:TPA: hypothetical protein U2J46_003492 [Providencia stuartii]|uniref:hypothetical protein n=1 Tax=Providencia TaxID=586 RepID=UPI001C226AA2|nr:hypothetical protein [Providencia rettgeri]QXB92542.1 hypothetical protein I6L81_06170 [Providencia rettgeri]HEM7519100.1 hypothetical protein [Providencia stuartii]
MLDKKMRNFGFVMDKSIPVPTVMEFIALKQVLLSVIAKLPYETRQEIVSELALVESPVMAEMVKNLKMIDQ